MTHATERTRAGGYVPLSITTECACGKRRTLTVLHCGVQKAYPVQPTHAACGQPQQVVRIELLPDVPEEASR